MWCRPKESTSRTLQEARAWRSSSLELEGEEDRKEALITAPEEEDTSSSPMPRRLAATKGLWVS